MITKPATKLSLVIAATTAAQSMEVTKHNPAFARSGHFLCAAPREAELDCVDDVRVRRARCETTKTYATDNSADPHAGIDSRRTIITSTTPTPNNIEKTINATGLRKRLTKDMYWLPISYRSCYRQSCLWGLSNPTHREGWETSYPTGNSLRPRGPEILHSQQIATRHPTPN